MIKSQPCKIVIFVLTVFLWGGCDFVGIDSDGSLLLTTEKTSYSSGEPVQAMVKNLSNQIVSFGGCAFSLELYSGDQWREEHEDGDQYACPLYLVELHKGEHWIFTLAQDAAKLPEAVKYRVRVRGSYGSSEVEQRSNEFKVQR